MRLKLVMDTKRMSIQKLAEKSGLSETYIRILLAESKSPTLRTLEKLANALAVSVKELIEDPHAKASGE